MPKGRPGGNPDLKQYQFTTDREEPLNVQLQLRITRSMADKLSQQSDKNQFVRDAIAEKLEREET